ncbi:hypothetical protein [Nocardioides aromaticivorans]|uniref:hypothetical protein n=1 Tax=Nocardioides aromaticivorans TaxID=200618 RepID=UPI001A8E5283|nr:hypothetical protein [Nocardioides aromaticivorans]
MSFTVTATVTVSADPAPLDEDRSPATAVFPISVNPDRANPDSASAVVGEVVCRGALAIQAREQLHMGQQIIVIGELTPRPALHRSTDGAEVILVIEATHISVRLTAIDSN